jgi:hypothetical protein
LGIKRLIALYNFFSTKGDRTFSIERSIALNCFLSGKGDRSFWYGKVDRPLLLFHGRRAIALFGIERSIALYDFFTGGGRSHFLVSKGRFKNQLKRRSRSAN